MQTITISNREFLICDIHETADTLKITKDKDDNTFSVVEYWYTTETHGIPHSFKLPFGNYKIIGRVSELDEQFCEELVEKIIFRHSVPARHSGFIDVHKYKDYLDDSFKRSGCCSAKQSFLSLLKSKGIDADNKLLIEKVK